MKTLLSYDWTIRTLNTFKRSNVTTIKQAKKLIAGPYISIRTINEIKAILG